MGITKELEITSVDSSNSHLCQVVDCNKPKLEEPFTVYLIRNTGDKFLFTAYFCQFHTQIFLGSYKLLASYVIQNKISGVNSSVFLEGMYG